MSNKKQKVTLKHTVEDSNTNLFNMVTIKVVPSLAATDANCLVVDPILAGPKPGRDPEAEAPAQAEGGQYDAP